jgi:arylsulfatase A-like enzyme
MAWAMVIGAEGVWLAVLHHARITAISYPSVLIAMTLGAAAVACFLGLASAKNRPASSARSIAAALVVILLWLCPFVIQPRPLAPDASAEPGWEVPKPRLNVVLIVADTLRADAVGVLGGKNRTPNLDRLAGDGVVFETAYSPAPHTVPSMLSLFSGLYPSAIKRGKSIFAVPETAETFAEKLRASGYRTAAVVAQPSLKASTGIYQGFDHVVTLNTFYRRAFATHMPFWGALGNRLGVRLGWWNETKDVTRFVLSRAIRVIEQAGDQPFFLWVHFLDPHDPYDPPRRFRSLSSRPSRCPEVFYEPMAAQKPEAIACYQPLYDAEVLYVDEAVGAFLSRLTEEGLDDRTVVAFLSDHGEEFYEHGGMLHGRTLYEELVRVPFFLRGPTLPRGVRIAEPVSTLDLFPTLEELLGLPARAALPRVAASLLPHIKGTDAQAPRGYVFCEGIIGGPDQRMLRIGSLKMIEAPSFGRREVYDLVSDPGEQHSMSLEPDRQEEFQNLFATIESLNAEIHGRTTAREGNFDDLRERLKDLGYLQ